MRLTREHWLEEGLEILREFAQDKIRILYLCKRLGVTRGSFYHHFKSIDDYVSELLKKWEKENTLMLIQVANKAASAEEQMQVLSDMVASRDKMVEVAIRSWSNYNTTVKEYLSRVDQIRLSYLVNVLEKMGLDKTKAEQRAKLEYALVVGIQHLFPEMNQQEMQLLYSFLS